MITFDPENLLPPWFTVPESHGDSHQMSLFHVPLSAMLPQLHVSTDELGRWRKQAWISFDPDGVQAVDEYFDPHIWEIMFVRDVVRSGLSDGQVLWFLAECPKPYAYDPDRIAYSFRHGWVMPVKVPTIELDPPDEVIEENIDAWLEECDDDRLIELRDLIEQILERRVEENGDTDL